MSSVEWDDLRGVPVRASLVGTVVVGSVVAYLLVAWSTDDLVLRVVATVVGFVTVFPVAVLVAYGLCWLWHIEDLAVPAGIIPTVVVLPGAAVVALVLHVLGAQRFGGVPTGIGWALLAVAVYPAGALLGSATPVRDRMIAIGLVVALLAGMSAYVVLSQERWRRAFWQSHPTVPALVDVPGLELEKFEFFNEYSFSWSRIYAIYRGTTGGRYQGALVIVSVESSGSAAPPCDGGFEYVRPSRRLCGESVLTIDDGPYRFFLHEIEDRGGFVPRSGDGLRLDADDMRQIAVSAVVHRVTAADLARLTVPPPG